MKGSSFARHFVAGLALLIAVPVAVLAGLWGMARFHNQTAGVGPLTCSLSADWAFVGQPLEYQIRYSGPAPADSPDLDRADIVIAIDVSGSMVDSLPAIKHAVGQLAANLLREGRYRLAVIGFDVPASQVVPWTSNTEAVARGLATVGTMDGDNDSRALFALLPKVMSEARPGSRKVVVMFTDGYLDACPANRCPTLMNWAEMETAAAGLRKSGVKIAAVGLPRHTFRQGLVRLTGSDALVHDPSIIGALATSLRQAAAAGSSVVGPNASLGLHLDGRNFEISSDVLGEWRLRGGQLALDVAPLPNMPAMFPISIAARHVGLWTVGQPPADMGIRDARGAETRHVCTIAPQVLVVSWGLLLLVFSPAILWILAHLGRLLMSTGGTVTETAHLLPRFTAPADPLPSLPPVIRQGPVIPTLIVGLGGGGAALLHARYQGLIRGGDKVEEKSHNLLLLDIDGRTITMPGVDVRLAPTALTNLDALASHGALTVHHLAVFQPETMRDRPRRELNLSEGARGDRRLARLAFFRWLVEGDVKTVLDDALKRLLGLPTPTGHRQILIAFDENGGFGSAVAIDVARLFRRISRMRQRAEGNAIPDIVLLSLSTGLIGPNAQSFQAELDTVGITGATPYRTTYCPEDPVLDCEDREVPYLAVLRLIDGEMGAAARRGAYLASLLADPASRREILAEMLVRRQESQRRGRGFTAEVWPSGLSVAAASRREAIARALFLYLIAGDNLLGLRPAPGGGFTVPAVTSDEAVDALQRWAESDGARNGGLEDFLIAIAAGASGTGSSLAVADDPWVIRAFAASLDAALGTDPSGRPPLTFAQASAALALIADTAPRMGFAALADIARPLAVRTAEWARTLGHNCHRVQQEFEVCLDHGDTAVKLLGHGWSMDDARAEAVRLLTEWLGEGASVELSRRLRFHVVLRGGVPDVVLATGFGTTVVHDGAESVSPVIMDWARSLAGSTPAAEAAPVLLRLDDKIRQTMIKDLAAQPERHDGSVLALPAAGTDREAAAALKAEVDSVALSLSACGPCRIIVSGDSGSIRRLAWRFVEKGPDDDDGATEVVQTPDWVAARWRKRMHNYYQRLISPLPPEIKIALLDEDWVKAFARAVADGGVFRSPDCRGRDCWWVAGVPLPLAADARAGLAFAAAVFVREKRVVPPRSAISSDAFAPLDMWRAGKVPSGWTDEDATVLALLALMNGEP